MLVIDKISVSTGVELLDSRQDYVQSKLHTLFLEQEELKLLPQMQTSLLRFSRLVV